MKGSYSIDLAWTPYEQSHDTFVTFEIESKQNDRLCKNMDKIFDSAAKDVEKPFHHFIVVYKGRIIRGNKDLIFEKARNKNVHIFENLHDNPEELHKFYGELEELAIPLSSTIMRQGRNNPVRTVQETISGLERITPCLIVQNKSYSINQATVCSSEPGKVNKSITLPNNSLFDSKKYKEFALVPIPREKYVFLIPGTSFSIDVYLDITKLGKSTFIMAETCDYPFVLELKSENNKTSFYLNFNPKITDFVQFDFFTKMGVKIDDNKTILIVDERGHKIYQGTKNTIDPTRPKESEYYEAISDTAYIQKVIGKRIFVPKDEILLAEDLTNARKIKQILDGGEITVEDLEDVAISMDGKTARKYFGLQSPNGVLPAQILKEDNVKMTLFKQEVELGELIAELPELKFKEGSDLANKVKECPYDSEIEICLIPVKSRKAKFCYPNWKKPS